MNTTHYRIFVVFLLMLLAQAVGINFQYAIEIHHRQHASATTYLDQKNLYNEACSALTEGWA